MNILVLSANGEGLGLARRLTLEGHKAKLYINEPCPIGEGIVKKVLPTQQLFGNPLQMDGLVRERLLDLDPDFTVADHWVFGNLQWPTPILGASKATVAPGLDERVAKEVLQKCGILGDPINCLVFAGHTAGAFVDPAYVLFPQHMLMVGNLGPYAGFTIFSASRVPLDSRLIQERLVPLSDFLGDFRGIVTVDLANNTWTTITNPQVLCILAEALPCGLAKYLLSLAEGKPLRDLVTRGTWVSASLLTTPPFPYTLPEEVGIKEVVGLCDDNARHFWLLSGMIQEGKLLVWPGIVGYSTAYAASLDNTRNRILRTLSEIRVEFGQYRTDVGRGASLRPLVEGGWLDEESLGKFAQDSVVLGRSGNGSSSPGECADGEDSGGRGGDDGDGGLGSDSGEASSG